MDPNSNKRTHSRISFTKNGLIGSSSVKEEPKRVQSSVEESKKTENELEIRAYMQKTLVLTAQLNDCIKNLAFMNASRLISQCREHVKNMRTVQDKMTPGQIDKVLEEISKMTEAANELMKNMISISGASFSASSSASAPSASASSASATPKPENEKVYSYKHMPKDDTPASRLFIEEVVKFNGIEPLKAHGSGKYTLQMVFDMIEGLKKKKGSMDSIYSLLINRKDDEAPEGSSEEQKTEYDQIKKYNDYYDRVRAAGVLGAFDIRDDPLDWDNKQYSRGPRAKKAIGECIAIKRFLDQQLLVAPENLKPKIRDANSTITTMLNTLRLNATFTGAPAWSQYDHES